MPIREIKSLDEFVRPEFIARYAGRTVADLTKMGFFDDIPYKIDYLSKKTYRYDYCIRKLGSYGMVSVTKNHPNAKWRPYEIIGDLGIAKNTYRNMVIRGVLKEETDEFGKYVTWKNYDYFLKNYVPLKQIDYLPPTLKVKDCAIFLGMGPRELTWRAYIGEASIVYKIDSWGAKRYKWMTREQLIDFINKDLKNCKYRTTKLIRKEPMPDKMTTNLACIYLKCSVYALKKLIARGYLVPEKIKRGIRRMNLFDKKDLDRVYDCWQAQKYYCEFRKYYSRSAIRNKFGKSDYWINNLIIGKCRVTVPRFHGKSKQPDGVDFLSPEEYAKRHAEAREQGRPGYPMWGWVKEDVEAVVATGVELDPEMEVSDFRKTHMDLLDKTKYRELNKRKKETIKNAIKKRKLADQMLVYERPITDEIELSIKTAFAERDLKAEEHRRELRHKRYQKEAERNQMRKLLGIDEKKQVTVTTEDRLKHSDTPQIVTILYRRKSDNAPILYKKGMSSKEECIFTSSDVTLNMIRAKRPQMSVFINVGRAAKRVSRIKPKVTPSWIILAHTTSIIYDPAFHQKLNQIPSDYGAVAPYGYEYILPDGTWRRCPNTYGMYSEFSVKDDLMTRRVAGTVSVTGNHEVAVLDGPFIAIRGGYLPMLKSFGKLYRFGDGRGCIPYVISMLMRRIGVKMMQMEVDCSWCSDVNVPYTTLEWNQIEPKMVDLSKKILPKKMLNPSWSDDIKLDPPI